MSLGKYNGGTNSKAQFSSSVYSGLKMPQRDQPLSLPNNSSNSVLFPNVITAKEAKLMTQAKFLEQKVKLKDSASVPSITVTPCSPIPDKTYDKSSTKLNTEDKNNNSENENFIFKADIILKDNESNDVKKNVFINDTVYDENKNVESNSLKKLHNQLKAGEVPTTQILSNGRITRLSDKNHKNLERFVKCPFLIDIF